MRANSPLPCGNPAAAPASAARHLAFGVPVRTVRDASQPCEGAMEAYWTSEEPQVSGPEASRHLGDPIRELDIHDQVREVWAHVQEGHAGHTAKTLVKLSHMRVVLMALRSGSVVPEHASEGEMALHVLSGRIRFDAAGETRDLSPGKLISISSELPHDIRAIEDSTLL